MKMKTKFNIYMHERSNPESDLIYVCSCRTKKEADFVQDSLEYKYKGGNTNNVSMYDFYIKEE